MLQQLCEGRKCGQIWHMKLLQNIVRCVLKRCESSSTKYTGHSLVLSMEGQTLYEGVSLSRSDCPMWDTVVSRVQF
jgi:hypothetical protein